MDAYDNVYVQAAVNLSCTAAAGQDGTAQTGKIIDREAYGQSKNLVIIITYNADLAYQQTLSFKNVILEHDDYASLSAAATFKTWENSTGSQITAGASGGVTNSPGCKAYAVNLSGAKRYIRLKYTPDLGATGTDAARYSALAVLGAPKYGHFDTV